MSNPLYIKKSNGETELFSFEKLKKSLQSADASEDLANTIVDEIQKDIYDGMSSNVIYKKALILLMLSEILLSICFIKKTKQDLGVSI